MPFGVPMMWREGKDHVTSCNFCMANLKSINPKNKQHGQYTGVPSAIKPVPMAQIFLFLYQMSPWNLVLIPNLVTRLIQLHVWSKEDDQPVPLTQAYFNDLTRDLNLSKDSTQLLGSHPWEIGLLEPGTTFYWYWERQKEFRFLFTFNEASWLVYCNNIADLI